MRFQGALKALFSGEYTDLSALAFDSGYFDQAHFIHDFKKFTAEAPYRFFKSCRAKR
ncbi:MAG: AraC family transcriptional regulator [Oscillibacter sp.]|nr:AraC family transcriptional regulator [Oscillibacter sp.]